MIVVRIETLTELEEATRGIDVRNSVMVSMKHAVQHDGVVFIRIGELQGTLMGCFGWESTDTYYLNLRQRILGFAEFMSTRASPVPCTCDLWAGCTCGAITPHKPDWPT